MFRTWLVVLAATCSLAAAKVFVLNDANFDRTLSENHPMMVEFYAPWCGHCKALEPEYEEASDILERKHAAIFLGKVDATAEDAAELAKRFQIQGFPTLKFFPKGGPSNEVIDYDGERKAANIVGWLEKRTGPAFTTLSTQDALQKAKEMVTEDNEKIIVIGVFSEEEQSKAFEEAAKKDYTRDYFAIFGNDKLRAILGGSYKAPFIFVHRSFNLSNPAILPSVGAISQAPQIEAFVKESSEPVSVVKTYYDYDIINNIKKGFHAVEFYAPWCGYCKQFAPEYEKVASYFLSPEGAALKVIVAKYDGTANEDLTSKENIESFPTIKLYKDGVSATFKGEMDKESVINFIKEKANVKAVPVGSIDAFVSDVPVALVACVAPENDGIIDTVAFQAASPTFTVGKLRCESGKERVEVYNSGVKRASYPADQAVGDITALSKWYKRAALSPVFKFDDLIFDEIMNAEYKYVVFYFDRNVNGDEPEIKLFDEFAASDKFKDTAYSYASSSEEYLMQYFQIKSDELPTVRLLDTTGSMFAYIGPKEVTAESIEKMFAQLSEGSLEKVVTPSEDDAGEPAEDDDYHADDEGEAAEDGDETEEGSDEDEEDEGDEGDDEEDDDDDDDDDEGQDEL